MRAFWIAVALLFGLIVGIWGNYHYINSVANELDARLDALPDISSPDCNSEARALLSYWEEQMDFVGLSVSYPVVDRLNEQAVALLAATECGDLYGYRSALALLRDAVGDMRRLEKFSIGNLF